MRGTAKLDNADDLEMTVTLTASLRDWWELVGSIKNDDKPTQHYPVNRLVTLVEQTIREARGTLSVVREEP